MTESDGTDGDAVLNLVMDELIYRRGWSYRRAGDACQDAADFFEAVLVEADDE